MVTVVVEGDTDLPVVRKVFDAVGLEVADEIDAGGKSNIDRKVSAWNAAAKGSPWFVLRDLDHDAPCAGALVEKLVPATKRSRLLCLRIAVREVESWLLADGARMAAFLRVGPQHVPRKPDGLADPKRAIVDLARRSPKPAVRAAIVPRQGASASVGPEYESWMIEFATRSWRAAVARRSSPSLDRCIVALARWRTLLISRGES